MTLFQNQLVLSNSNWLTLKKASPFQLKLSIPNPRL
jgi:hypothetical protein